MNPANDDLNGDRWSAYQIAPVFLSVHRGTRRHPAGPATMCPLFTSDGCFVGPAIPGSTGANSGIARAFPEESLFLEAQLPAGPRGGGEPGP